MVQDAQELELSRKILRALAPSVILEIGVDCGGSLTEWGRCATPDAMLIGVDPCTDHAVIEAIPTQDVRIVSMYSKDAVPFVLNMLPKKVDFLFIDADHSYEAVKQDFELWSPMVRAGGVIGFHDVADPNVGVQRFWLELHDLWRTSGNWYKTELNVYNPGMGTGFIFDWH